MHIRLTAEKIKEIDKKAKAYGYKNRSAFIKSALQKYTVIKFNTSAFDKYVSSINRINFSNLMLQLTITQT
ncbi:MAG: ribbon-helix-helix domain-containing protein [Erysipelotrichaceae bacterium]